MREIVFIASILTGYAAVSLGVVKILWRVFGVHFYAAGHSHPPEAPFYLDVFLIAALITGGLLLVVFSRVVPALMTVLAVTLYEFLHLHHDHHDFWQIILTAGILVGQIITLYLALLMTVEDWKEDHA